MKLVGDGTDRSPHVTAAATHIIATVAEKEPVGSNGVAPVRRRGPIAATTVKGEIRLNIVTRTGKKNRITVGACYKIAINAVLFSPSPSAIIY